MLSCIWVEAIDHAFNIWVVQSSEMDLWFFSYTHEDTHSCELWTCINVSKRRVFITTNPLRINKQLLLFLMLYYNDTWWIQLPLSSEYYMHNADYSKSLDIRPEEKTWTFLMLIIMHLYRISRWSHTYLYGLPRMICWLITF